MTEVPPILEHSWIWPLLAAVLLAIAFQPPFARLVWRDGVRSIRRKNSAHRGLLGNPNSLLTTIDWAVILTVAFIAIAVAAQPAWPVPLLAAIAAVLLVLALLDQRFYWLPDRITLTFGLSGFAVNVGRWDLIVDSLIAGASAGLAFYAIARGYRALRQHDGLGLGDVKLVAALGVWIGLEALPHMVLLACATALVAALGTLWFSGATGAQTRIPFGLHLAAAGWAFICMRAASPMF